MKIKNIIEGIVLIIAIAVFGVAGYKLYAYNAEAKKESETVSALSANAVRIYKNQIDTAQGTDSTGSGTDSTGSGTDSMMSLDGMQAAEITLDIDFDYLTNENEDIKAWIYCPDTVINYPVLQAQDNEFYLHRLTNKTYNSAGSLFIDCKNSPDFSDYLTIIYGHHMKNGSMFGGISNYKKQEYYDEHPKLYLATPELSYTVDLIAGFVTDAVSETYIIPENVDERDEFLSAAIKKSTFDADMEISDLSEDDRLVMLSTCSYEYENARFVVIGVLK
jgi:sortase B